MAELLDCVHAECLANTEHVTQARRCGTVATARPGGRGSWAGSQTPLLSPGSAFARLIHIWKLPVKIAAPLGCSPELPAWRGTTHPPPLAPRPGGLRHCISSSIY